jgi:uncharacterized protein (TIGR00299 family) protein
MRIGYIEAFSGISGDMMLGALVDAGVPVHLLEETVTGLGVGARLDVSRVERSGISATKVDVWAGSEKDMPRDEYWRKHGHDHQHKHGHSHRGLKEICEVIGGAAIASQAKQNAIAMFEALGAAEAKIHNVAVEKVHFHEVGAVDAIVDIVCAAVGAHSLSVEEWVCSPLNLGGGTVNCAHGRFPVPAPASLELLKGAPVYSSGIDVELTTPTGAAIAKVLARRFGPMPAMNVTGAGYGAGSRDLPGHANVLRITLGEALEIHPARSFDADTVTVLEANVDDLNPQVFGYVIERALAEGALDVFGTPVQMKKNRPGMLLTVLCRPEDAERMTKLIFVESTTLGIRMREERRQVLARRSVEVETPWGKVRMKLANLNGTVANFAPEYEDCRRIAAERGIPLKQVMQEAMRAYLEKKELAADRRR